MLMYWMVTQDYFPPYWVDGVESYEWESERAWMVEAEGYNQLDANI